LSANSSLQMQHRFLETGT